MLTLLFSLHRRWLRIIRAVTLGSRAIVVQDESVLLVRLTYYKGWFLPGGGVNRGETFEAAMARELKEECGISPVSAQLQGLYLNQKGRHTDHVAVFVVREFKGTPGIQDQREIAEVRFFPINDLPETLWKGHRRRIHEMLGREPMTPRW